MAQTSLIDALRPALRIVADYDEAVERARQEAEARLAAVLGLRRHGAESDLRAVIVALPALPPKALPSDTEETSTDAGETAAPPEWNCPDCGYAGPFRSTRKCRICYAAYARQWKRNKTAPETPPSPSCQNDAGERDGAPPAEPAPPVPATRLEMTKHQQEDALAAVSEAIRRPEVREKGEFWVALLNHVVGWHPSPLPAEALPISLYRRYPSNGGWCWYEIQEGGERRLAAREPGTPYLSATRNGRDFEEATR